jgi:hypothetical protein
MPVEPDSASFYSFVRYPCGGTQYNLPFSSYNTRFADFSLKIQNEPIENLPTDSYTVTRTTKHKPVFRLLYATRRDSLRPAFLSLGVNSL